MLVGHLQSFRQVVCGPKDSKWHSLTTDDNTHPEDLSPVEMTTPAPREKIWLASDVHRTSPVPYSDVDTTTVKPGTSTVRAPRAQSTKRQGRSMVTSGGTVISEARLGTIPYMAAWSMFLYVLLALQLNLALALSDHDRQVIAYDCGNPSGIQAYDTGEQIISVILTRCLTTLTLT
jgi:hypothetical protein